MNPYEIRRANLRARMRQEVCACGDDTSCPSCVNVKEAEGWEHVADLMERRQWRWADGTYNAPPLSLAEHAAVARFESAPDPYEGEL